MRVFYHISSSPTSKALIKYIHNIIKIHKFPRYYIYCTKIIEWTSLFKNINSFRYLNRRQRADVVIHASFKTVDPWFN